MSQGNLRLLVLKENHDNSIAGHGREKNIISKVLLAMHERRDSPLCDPNLLPKASQPLTTIAEA